MCRLRKTCVCVLFVVMFVWVIPFPALAQDSLTAQYASVSGLSLSYPAGWMVIDEGSFIALTNDLAAINADVLSSGTVGIVVIDPVAVAWLLGDSSTLSVADIDFVTAALLGAGQGEWELLDAEAIAIADRSATRVTARSAVADGLILIIDFDDGKNVVVAAMTPPGEMDQTEELVRAVAASVEYAPMWRAMLQGHTDYVKAVAFSPDGAQIASASNDGTARVWDVATGAEVRTLAHGNWVQAVAFSPDGALIATGGIEGFGGVVRVWDAAVGELVAELVHAGQVNSVAFSPDGALIASGAENDPSIHLWTFDGTWQEIASLSGHADWIQAVAFSPDGARLASAAVDGTARVWDVASGTELLVLEHPDVVNSIAFSPVAALIVTGSEGGIVRLWDAATGDPVAELAGHLGAVTAVAFSPDGALIASGSHDKTIRVWAFDGAWQEKATLKGHSDWIRSVDFSPDGTLLGSGSDDGNVILWEAPR